MTSHKARRVGPEDSVRAADLQRLSQAAVPLAPQQLVTSILGGHARGGRLVWSGGLVETLHEFGFSAGSARVALGRLARSYMLARVRDGRFIHYRLTTAGEALMAEGDRRIFSFGRDKRSSDVWTVVWHAIPEEQRLTRWRLARRLRFLGFGQLQDGTWAAPHNMERETGKLLAELDMAEYSIVFLGRPAQSPHFGALIRRGWNLENLAHRYERFNAAISPFLDTPPSRDLEAFVVRTLMVHLFRQFPFDDPELLDDSIGVAALRGEAVAMFHELFSTLKEPAQRHFEATTAAPGKAPER